MKPMDQNRVDSARANDASSADEVIELSIAEDETIETIDPTSVFPMVGAN